MDRFGTRAKLGMWESRDLSVSETLDSIAPSIVTMFKKGWFDDAVGVVEGFEIFCQLTKHGISTGFCLIQPMY